MSAARATPTPRNSVTILAVDGSMEMSIVMARDLFHAGAVAQLHAEPATTVRSREQVLVATQDGERVQTSSGSRYQRDCSIADVEHTDLIVVSGIWCEVEQLIETHRTTIDRLLEQHQRGAMIACLHTGTFLFAKTGLLDNKVATVFWHMVDEFESHYPNVSLQPGKNITSTGHHLTQEPLTVRLQSCRYRDSGQFADDVGRMVLIN